MCQPYLHSEQVAVPRHKIKALVVVHDLRVVTDQCPGYNIVHAVGKGQEQFMGPALAQRFGEVALRIYVQCQNFLTAYGKTDSQVVDSRAFADTALLICYTYSPLLLPLMGFLLSL